MFPDRATLYVSGIEDRERMAYAIDWWDEVYGFNMSCVRKAALSEPLVDIVDSNKVVTNSCLIREVDLQTCTKEDISYNCCTSCLSRVKVLLGFFLMKDDICNLTLKSINLMP